MRDSFRDLPECLELASLKRTSPLKTEESGDENHPILYYSACSRAPSGRRDASTIETGHFCACRHFELASLPAWLVTRRGHAGISSYGHILS